MRITTLGTCRIYKPIDLAAREGLVTHNNTSYRCYAHSAAELIQQIRVLRGEQSVARALHPFVFGVEQADFDPRLDLLDRTLDESDVVLVEISSAKTLRMAEAVLQVNYLGERLVERSEALQLWWKSLLAQAAGTASQRALPPEDGLSSLERRIVRELTVSIDSEEAVARDMRTIVRLLDRPVVFVTHYGPSTLPSARLEERRRLIDLVAKSAEALGRPCVQPAPIVRRYGQKNALAGGGSDLNHYDPEFDAVLAHAFLKACRAVGPGSGHSTIPAPTYALAS